MPVDPVNRRQFFRAGFRELLRPLAELAEPIEEAAREFGKQSARRSVSLKVWLRPPGALPEADFLSKCSRCGECVKACPAECIRIDSSGRVAGGAPYIDAEAMPCVVCDGLYCMAKCPSGALLPTPVEHIDMGTAEWHENRCLRTDGEQCTICIDQCPLGSAAIELRDERVHVIEEGCIGCGVCQYYCPTSPRSITVKPRAA